MTKRVKSTKVGDVFEVPISSTQKRYIQYIVSDLTQLNSDVIRAFKKVYDISDKPSLFNILSDDVDFFMHTTTKLGIKMELWSLYGNSDEKGDYRHVVFRDSYDLGNPQIKISERWFVWHINDEEFEYVGKITGEYRKSEMGLVFSPRGVVERLKGENYLGVYPRFE